MTLTDHLWPFGVVLASWLLAWAAVAYNKRDIRLHPTVHAVAYESAMEDLGNLLDTGDINPK